MGCEPTLAAKNAAKVGHPLSGGAPSFWWGTQFLVRRLNDMRSKNPIGQMFLALAGFVVAIALIESGGLKEWAGRLEPGPLRTIAGPVTAAVDKVVQPLGVGGLRDRALDEAARLGWSDDAARLARSSRPATFRPAESQMATNAAAGTKTLPSVLAAAAVAPLISNVPRTTSLAPLPALKRGKARVVALTGDSMMAVGLAANLMRQGTDDGHLRFVRAFRSGTGLARPDVFDWASEYPAMIGSERPDVVLVAIGANDGQGFEVNGEVQLFGTQEWRRTYQSRVADFLAMLENSGARVVWVGLPPTRMPAYNQRIALINRIAYTVVSRDPRATWWNSAPFVADDSGGFREFASLPDGRTLRLRKDDGIHFSEEGAGLMSSVLMRWLDAPRESAGNGSMPVGTAISRSPGAHGPATVAAASAEPARPRFRAPG